MNFTVYLVVVKMNRISKRLFYKLRWVKKTVNKSKVIIKQSGIKFRSVKIKRVTDKGKGEICPNLLKRNEQTQL